MTPAVACLIDEVPDPGRAAGTVAEIERRRSPAVAEQQAIYPLGGRTMASWACRRSAPVARLIYAAWPRSSIIPHAT